MLLLPRKLRRRKRPPCAAAAEVLRSIADESGHVERWSLEATADDMRKRGAFGLAFPDPDVLAKNLRYKVEREPGAPCGGLALFDRTLIVRASHDARREYLALLHELAHAELDELGVDHGHGDVWLLTLALAVPRSELRRPGLDLRRESWVSGWAVDLRIAMGRQ